MSPYFFAGRHFCTNAHGTLWMIGAIFVKFSQFILIKIIIIVATRYQILKLNAPNSISTGAQPDPAGAAYSVPPDPLAGFKGPTSKGTGGKKREGRSPPTFYSGSTLMLTYTLAQITKSIGFLLNKSHSHLSVSI